jgi:hypothetical protein
LPNGEPLASKWVEKPVKLSKKPAAARRVDPSVGETGRGESQPEGALIRYPTAA